MNVIREIERINAKELENGIYGGSGKGSWHEKYKNSAWVYVGGLPYELTEGDIICVMSQWGEIEDINLVREKGTNKSQGFAFVKYEDQRSTILAVDNFNGIEILQRMIRVDHVDQYKLPKEVREREEELLDENPDANVNIGPGHAYKSQSLMNEYSITSGVDHWAKPQRSAPSYSVSEAPSAFSTVEVVHSREHRDTEKENKKKKLKEHKHKEHKKDASKKTKKHHKRRTHSDDDSNSADEKHSKKHKHNLRERDRDRDEDNDRQRKRDRESITRHNEKDARQGHEHDLDASGQSRSSSSLIREPPSSSSFSGGGAATVAAGGGDGAYSWRGRRDPALQTMVAGSGGRGGQGGARRDEFSGYGGMHRRR